MKAARANNGWQQQQPGNPYYPPPPPPPPPRGGPLPPPHQQQQVSIYCIGGGVVVGNRDRIMFNFHSSSFLAAPQPPQGRGGYPPEVSSNCRANAFFLSFKIPLVFPFLILHHRIMLGEACRPWTGLTIAMVLLLPDSTSTNNNSSHKSPPHSKKAFGPG